MKSSILFLVPYPIGKAASQRFRFEQYMNLLESNGYRLRLQPFWDEQGWEILYKKGYRFQKSWLLLKGILKRWGVMFSIPGYSWVFIHRECAPVGPPLFEWIISKLFRKKIIYDFDDAIWLANTSQENRIVGGVKWNSKVKQICRWSTRVSCGNSYLADFAMQFASTVIINPTTIDTEGLHVPASVSTDPNRQSFVIGWTGTHSTLVHLEPLLSIIETLYKKYPFITLMVIADRDPGWSFPFVRFVTWKKDTEIADLMKMDAGIMPLPDDEWSRGKCGFKALQYMSLEKPTLVSPVGVNSRIVHHGVDGFHCQSPGDWLQYLEEMIQQPRLRKSMGVQGRNFVEANYSVVSNSRNFLALFE